MPDSDKVENSSRPNPSRAIPKQQSAKLLSLKAHLIFWPLVVIGLSLDLWTKKVVFNRLYEHGSIPIINGFVQLVLAENEGAAFGIAAGQHHLLVTVSVVALMVILAIFLCSGTSQRLIHVALGLVAAGVCGNLWDRIFNNGRVRDFIDVVYWPGKHWPAFNVADSLLCIGVGLLIISTLFTGKPFQKHSQPHK